MQVKYKVSLNIGAITLGIAGVVLAVVSASHDEKATEWDVRTLPPLVKVTTVAVASGAERKFTGLIAARVQSNLGFRVSGKILERFVDDGEVVKAGQPLMRIDENDLKLEWVARQNAVASERATVVQSCADERRLAALMKKSATSEQSYEQAKALMESAEAQLAAAEANASVAENEVAYSVLKADSDGTVIETMGEPGQVVSAGQTVVRLARSGPREAVVFLPETVRPALGSHAEASVYGIGRTRTSAVLRQLSDSADPQTRTYEARYVLDGEAASAPLGSTVTIHLAGISEEPEVEVPIGAIHDDGKVTGIWILNSDSTVHFQPVDLLRLTEESAVIGGVEAGQPIVALGAHLLREGARIKTLDTAEVDR